MARLPAAARSASDSGCRDDGRFSVPSRRGRAKAPRWSHSRPPVLRNLRPGGTAQERRAFLRGDETLPPSLPGQPHDAADPLAVRGCDVGHAGDLVGDRAAVHLQRIREVRLADL
jgi:hypothetical protein